ncbi:hypothetical protein CRE_24130 [Caenorhabditis remanei]|uniref:Uncharacterized protein n=1 Tax=Caenorhabditis remanei TaxID=31234 RepID=E3N432_CAERE|nr:hypothetical protein CRE_24130 [Caenorhabditis remanei]
MKYTWEEERKLVKLTLNAVNEYDPDSLVPERVFDVQEFRDAFPGRTPLGLCANVKEGVDGQYNYEFMPDEDRELDLEEHDEAEHEEQQQPDPQQPEPIRVRPTLRTFFFLLAQMVAQLGDDNDEHEEDNNVLADLSNQIAAINVNELDEGAMTDMISGFLTRGLQL